MRYELGDRIDSINFGAPASSAAPVFVGKTDHRATMTADEATGEIHFAVPACDPATENPLIGLKAVLVPVAAGLVLPADAAGFLKLVEDDPANHPKGEVDVTAAQYGTTVVLPAPDFVQHNVFYAVQAIHVYED